MAKKWKVLGEQQFRFLKEGDTLEGVLTGKEESALGVGLYHIIPTGQEESVVILGSLGLDRLLEDVEIGSELRIVLVKVKPTRGGTRFKDYEVSASVEV
jgi:hypothetical protein